MILQLKSLDAYGTEIVEKTLLGGMVTGAVWVATVIYVIILVSGRHAVMMQCTFLVMLRACLGHRPW